MDTPWPSFTRFAGGYLILPLSIASTLAWAGHCVQTHTAFVGEDRRMRVKLMLGTMVWIAHNVLLGAWVNVLAELAFLTSNGVGLLRFYVVPMRRKMRPSP